MDAIYLILLGIIAGLLSGVLGIGGAIIIVPALVLLFGKSQHLAQGTTMALMVPPIGLLGAWTYYKGGFVDLRIAVLVCLGFVFGCLFGARMAVSLPDELLRKLFGAVLFIASMKMLFQK